RVSTALEDGEGRVRNQRVDLLGLVHGADPVVATDRDPRRTGHARELGAAVVGRILVADDEVAHRHAIARGGAGGVAGGGPPAVGASRPRARLTTSGRA